MRLLQIHYEGTVYIMDPDYKRGRRRDRRRRLAVLKSRYLVRGSALRWRKRAVTIDNSSDLATPSFQEFDSISSTDDNLPPTVVLSSHASF